MKISYGLLMVFLFMFSTLSVAEPYHGAVRDFVGINSNVGAYDNGIVARLGKAAEWMREYHRWEFYEQKSNIYGWDDKTPAFNGGSWPFHTKFVQECVKNNINMVLCAERSTEWASSNGDWNGPPYGSTNGTTEADYRDKAEFIAQAVARYGSQKMGADKLQTSDKLSGLNYIQYYEDENEPDQWWWQPTWPAPLYAKYLNAVHDGYNVPPLGDYPLIGIKNVDPGAVHVLGGLTGESLDYLDQIIANTGGRIPFDVINFHHYCTTGSSGRTPEDESFGLEKISKKFLEWRDQHTPGLPVWCSEFGWDTYKNDQGKGSYIYAPEPSQANYLLRSLFLFMGYGMQKAFVFFDVDPNSIDITPYASSGIMTDKARGLKPKISFYYMATLKNLLGDYTFDHVDSYRQGNPEIYSYCFKSSNEANRFCYVIWCRKPKAKADDGTMIADYRFEKAGIEAVQVMEPVHSNEFGQEINVTLENAGAANAAVILPQISEKPIFVFVTLNAAASVSDKKKAVNDFNLRTFPNPFNSAFTITYELPRLSDVRLNVYDIAGRLVKSIERTGQAQGSQCEQIDFSGDQPTGVYLIDLRAGDLTKQQKICYVR